MHTSTVTVAFKDDNYTLHEYSDSDFRVEWFSGTGKGGQHRNKHQNSCRLIHEPTGIVETRQGRKRESNLKEAKSALIKKLMKMETSLYDKTQNESVKTQIGSGMRGDKIRTYRFQDDRITDHIVCKSFKLKTIMRGNMDKIWTK